MAQQTRFIQVGVTAMRDPMTGDFLPAVPLYIEATQETEEEVEKLTEDIGTLLAHRMRKYQAACKAAGVAI